MIFWSFLPRLWCNFLHFPLSYSFTPKAPPPQDYSMLHNIYPCLMTSKINSAKTRDYLFCSSNLLTKVFPNCNFNCREGTYLNRSYVKEEYKIWIYSLPKALQYMALATHRVPFNTHTHTSIRIPVFQMTTNSPNRTMFLPLTLWTNAQGKSVSLNLSDKIFLLEIKRNKGIFNSGAWFNL